MLKTRITVARSHLLAALLVLNTLPAISTGPSALAYCTSQLTPAQENTDKGSITFESVLNGSMQGKGATSISFQDYKSHDGAILESRIETYPSPNRARAEMKRLLRHSALLVESNSALDGQGRRVGDRAVAEFGKAMPPTRRATVLWTDGRDVHILESSSLRYVLAFEKRYYPYHFAQNAGTPKTEKLNK